MGHTVRERGRTLGARARERKPSPPGAPRRGPVEPGPADGQTPLLLPGTLQDTQSAGLQARTPQTSWPGHGRVSSKTAGPLGSNPQWFLRLRRRSPKRGHATLTYRWKPSPLLEPLPLLPRLPRLERKMKDAAGEPRKSQIF